jgi:hypothetical protein
MILPHMDDYVFTMANVNVIFAWYYVRSYDFVKILLQSLVMKT